MTKDQRQEALNQALAASTKLSANFLGAMVVDDNQFLVMGSDIEGGYTIGMQLTPEVIATLCEVIRQYSLTSGSKITVQ